MKISSLFLIIYIFLFFTCSTKGQEKIDYGSNNGKYLSIFNTRIYYEEYGVGTPLILLHGGFSSIKYYGMVIPELDSTGTCLCGVHPWVWPCSSRDVIAGGNGWPCFINP